MKSKPLFVALAAIGLFLGLFLFFGGGKSGGFSGERALAHAAAVVAFGERTPGSEGSRKAQAYIEAALAEAGWTTLRQEFEAETPRGTLPFVNLRARFAGKDKLPVDWNDGGGMVVVGSHYDTKFIDGFPFVGANDGGSSTGALLELALVLAADPDRARRVELVFFDGEENIGGEYTANDGLFGSREYAKLWRGAPPEKKPAHGLVLDMIGDPQLAIKPPQDSPRPLLLALYAAATDLGYRKYFGLNPTDIIDDHVPLNQAGIPTLDIIDLDYPHWHQAGDTVDKLSARSLEIVGSVTARLLEKLLPPP